VFHTEYQNAQTQATSFPYNVTATNFNYKGVEYEMEARPIPELSFYGSLGVLSAETESGPQAGVRPHFAPPLEFSVGAEYRRDFDHDVTGFVGVNDVYTAQFITDPSNIPSVTQSAYHLLNAQLGAEFKGGKYRLTLDGKNLNSAVYFLATSPNAVQFYGPPRTFYVTLSARL
jgi:iron complex outermembrane recepter protein